MTARGHIRNYTTLTDVIYPGVTNLQDLRGVSYRQDYNEGLEIIKKCTKDNIYEKNVQTILDQLRSFGDFSSLFGVPPGFPPAPTPRSIPVIPL